MVKPKISKSQGGASVISFKKGPIEGNLAKKSNGDNNELDELDREELRRANLAKAKKAEQDYKNSEELRSLSGFHKEKQEHGGAFNSNKERLEALIATFENAVAVMEGLFVYRPTQGQAYALTNLTSQLQSIMSQLDQSYNFKDMGAYVMSTAVEPALENLLINLSKHISITIKNLDLDKSERKQVKQALSEMLKDYAVEVKEISEKLEENIVTSIMENR